MAHDDLDLERLKIHRIQDRHDHRRHLPQLGAAGRPAPAPALDVDEATAGSGVVPAEPVDVGAVRDRVVAALKTVYDPEIPVNVYDLGLIYGFEVSPEGRVELEMTLTAPACPVAGQLVQEVAERVGHVDGVSTAHVTLTWDPPWTKDRMTEDAMLELGLL